MSWNLGFKFTLAGEKLRKLRVNTDAISTGAASDAKQGLSAHHLENLCWKKTQRYSANWWVNKTSFPGMFHRGSIDERLYSG